MGILKYSSKGHGQEKHADVAVVTNKQGEHHGQRDLVMVALGLML